MCLLVTLQTNRWPTFGTENLENTMNFESWDQIKKIAKIKILLSHFLSKHNIARAEKTKQLQ